MGNSSSGDVCGCCVPHYERITIGEAAKTITLERNEIHHFEMPITSFNRDDLRKKVDGHSTLIEVDIHVDEGELKQAFMARKGRFPNGKQRPLWPQAGLKDQSDPDGKLGRLLDAHGGMTFRMSAINTEEFEVADYYIALRAGIRAKCHVSAYIVREPIRAPEEKQRAHATIRASDLTSSGSDEKRGGDIPAVVTIRPDNSSTNGISSTAAAAVGVNNNSSPPAAQLPPSVVVPTPVAQPMQPAVRPAGTIVIRTAPGLTFHPATNTAGASSVLSPRSVPLQFSDAVEDPYSPTPAASSSKPLGPPPSADSVFGPAPTTSSSATATSSSATTTQASGTTTAATQPQQPSAAAAAPAKMTVVSAATVKYDKPEEDFEI